MKKVTIKYILGVLMGYAIGFVPFAILEYIDKLQIADSFFGTWLYNGISYGLLSSMLVLFLVFIKLKYRKYFIFSLIIILLLYLIFLFFLFATFYLFLKYYPFGGQFG